MTDIRGNDGPALRERLTVGRTVVSALVVLGSFNLGMLLAHMLLAPVLAAAIGRPDLSLVLGANIDVVGFLVQAVSTCVGVALAGLVAVPLVKQVLRR